MEDSAGSITYVMIVWFNVVVIAGDGLNLRAFFGALWKIQQREGVTFERRLSFCQRDLIFSTYFDIITKIRNHPLPFIGISFFIILLHPSLSFF